MDRSPNEQTVIPEFLSGGGELGARIREYDWSKTSLGPVSSWPQSLRTCVRIMLSSRQPIWIGWGKDLIKLYNDPYKAIVGGKHPWALGTPASIVWKDIWKDIEHMLHQVMDNDEGTYVESQLLIMERNGYPEETYYTFSYTPIPGDDGSTAGMICANTDDTDRIISERQLRTLTQLGKNLTDCKSNKEIIEKTINTLKENPYDFPFALFRIISDNKAILAQSTELGPSEKIITSELDLNADNELSLIIRKAIASKKIQLFENISQRVGQMPKGAWGIAPEKAIVLPIIQTGIKDPFGVLVIGLNPFRLWDEKYLSFFSLVSDQVATSFADVHVLKEERKRIEALSELDKAKTIFFSNISHEFRTPLTLLLGPIEETINDPADVEANKLRMEVAYNNALRMQKLVNTLLDFSRIEAGRLEGKFSRVDICTFTNNLVSSFRSAIESVGMKLAFNCEEIHDEVYVDTDMWEKIVLNLVSNAFKYSKKGTIDIRVKQVKNNVQFSVKDSGTGIPKDQLELIFNRFHRIENTDGRSLEGTGIGLSMVKELVKLHFGKISVSSQLGKGSLFTVSIPVGKGHLQESRIIGLDPTANVSTQADVFVREALKWNAEDVEDPDYINMDSSVDNIIHSADISSKKYKVVLADDNLDMRAYMERLLSSQYQVINAVNGEDAFNKIIRHNPDLLLSDIMMPKLDGFGLLKKIRNHPDRKNLPVIFLSARADEEAKVEGLDAGADDYLVKPFSSKELLARVDANIKIAKSRIAAENNLRRVIMQSPVAMAILMGDQFIIEMANQKALEVWGKKYEEVINQSAMKAFPELIEQGFDKILSGVYTTGKPFIANEMPVTLIRKGIPETLFINFIYEPLNDSEGKIQGIVGVGIDVSEQVKARTKIEQSQKELNEMANVMPQLVWVGDPDGKVIYYNDRVAEYEGASKNEEGTWDWETMIHPEDQAATMIAWNAAIKTGTVYQAEHRAKKTDGNFRWLLSRGIPYKDENGSIVKWFGTATDIHASKEQAQILEEEIKKRTKELNDLNLSLAQSNKELQQFAHVASHDLKEPIRKIKTFTGRLAADQENIITEKSREYINKVNSAADRMLKMIEGVLDYSMLNAQEQKLEIVDLNEIVKNIETDLELIITQKSAKIFCDELPSISGAAILLYQLFYNLINNSLKFSRPGKAPVIEIKSSRIKKDNQDIAVITVTDNGIGFEQEYAENIFNTFTRLNSKDQYEGTGLGLSLCKRIVERHQGSIRAESNLQNGSRFIIEMPVFPASDQRLLI